MFIDYDTCCYIDIIARRLLRHSFRLNRKDDTETVRCQYVCSSGYDPQVATVFCFYGHMRGGRGDIDFVLWIIKLLITHFFFFFS